MYIGLIILVQVLTRRGRVAEYNPVGVMMTSSSK